MSRQYPGRYRVLVKYTWPDGSPGIDWTHTPDAYEECQKLLIVLGWGHPWEVVTDGKAVNVRVTGGLIVPVAE